jgi:hypothetical protein
LDASGGTVVTDSRLNQEHIGDMFSFSTTGTGNVPAQEGKRLAQLM